MKSSNDLKDEALASAMKSICDGGINPDDWMNAYVLLNGITYDYKTDSIRENSEVIEYATIIAQMRLSAFRNDVTEIKSYLSDALHLWKREQARIFILSLRDHLSFVEAKEDRLADWVRAATGAVSPLDLAVMRHFIWQVKRKLLGLPVEHHMMPILYGRTGGGKSVAVHKLLEPVKEVTLCRDMSVFSDSFGRRQFARNFVMFFDEMEKCCGVDVNALKNIITSPVVEWRVMRSEAVFSSLQNSTFIGCTNDPVSERINDTTSARRFWQVNCADLLDWDTINSIDYMALWRSVEEAADCPLLPYLSEIQAIQHRDIRAKDLIEQWLELACEPAPFDAESPTTNELFVTFMDWCRWQGINAFPGLGKFSRSLDLKLKNVGWSAGSKRSSRGTVWAVRFKGSVGTNRTEEVS